MPREIGAVAPVLAATEKEDLYAGLATVFGDGKDVGICDRLRIDALVGLDVRQCANAVPIDSSAFEIKFGAGCFHQVGQVFLRPAAFALQEVARLGNQLRILLSADFAGAGR